MPSKDEVDRLWCAALLGNADMDTVAKVLRDYNKLVTDKPARMEFYKSIGMGDINDPFENEIDEPDTCRKCGAHVLGAGWLCLCGDCVKSIPPEGA